MRGDCCRARLFGIVILVALAAAACGPRVAATRGAVSAPVQLDLLRLPRVWVAGFVQEGEGRAGFDLSTETVQILRQQLKSAAPAGVVDRGMVALTDERQFADHQYWQRLGEERGSPLIVTGTVRLRVAPPVQVQRGRRTTYLHGSGRVLAATVVLIDGETGEMIATRSLPERTRYGGPGESSPMTLYYGLMRQTLPDWLAAIARPRELTHAGLSGPK